MVRLNFFVVKLAPIFSKHFTHKHSKNNFFLVQIAYIFPSCAFCPWTIISSPVTRKTYYHFIFKLIIPISSNFTIQLKHANHKPIWKSRMKFSKLDFHNQSQQTNLVLSTAEAPAWPASWRFQAYATTAPSGQTNGMWSPQELLRDLRDSLRTPDSSSCLPNRRN